MKENSRNPYLNYYLKQAGSGYGSFDGQRGKGKLGDLWRNQGLPFLKYLGRNAFNAGTDIASDFINGEPLTHAIKTRGKRKMREMAGDLANRAEVFRQTGRGRKRRRKTRTRKLKKSKKSSKKRRTISKIKRQKQIKLF